MIGLLGLVLVAAVVAAAGVAGVAVLVARNRRRRNRVVPEVDTGAPAAWAGAHTPLARLHRRLVAAVVGARAVPDPDGALIAARVEVERAAVSVDEHLVALHAMSERERAGRMAQATAAVASVEEAAAKLTDVAAASSDRAMPVVEAALERARLVEEARRELDADPAAILDDARIDGTPPALPDEAVADQAPEPDDTDEDGDGRGQSAPGTA